VAVRELFPQSEDLTQLRESPRADLLAGLSVAVVALPLALAFGVASGVGAAAGLASAIVAGITAAIFGGCRVQVTGPSGAMTVVLIPIVAAYGPHSVFIIGFLAGLILVGFALTGAAALFRYIPLSVVEGFTLGIAFLIGIQQIPMALGVKADSTSVVLSALDALAHPSAINSSAVLVAISTVVFILVMRTINAHIPGGIIAVIAATTFVWLTNVSVPTVGSIPSQLNWIGLPSFSEIPIQHLVIPALSVAGLAAIEGLLCATVADNMANLPAHNPNREMFGQGVSNLVAPLFAGVPATAVIARTAVNIRSGGRSRLSTFSHSVFLFLAMMLAAKLVSHIPLASLAGVLIATSLKMVEGKRLIEFIKRTPHHFYTVAGTAVATLFLDLVKAVALGLVIAGAISFLQNQRTRVQHEHEISEVEAVLEEILHDEK
jgi:SulP family sulfate permease